jgi:hypothetical protein
MSYYLVNEEYAKGIAVNFLQQYHSILKVESAVLEGGNWIVAVLVSEPKATKFHVKINAKTGYIEGFQ